MNEIHIPNFFETILFNMSLDNITETDAAFVLMAFITISGIVTLRAIQLWYRNQLDKRAYELKKSKIFWSANRSSQYTKTNLNDYVTLDMLEENKNMFHDVLKGFEEYALLKGHKVSVSVDTSTPNKISFKIVISDKSDLKESEQSVKSDLDEYISKIMNGDSIDDLAETLNPIEHARVISALKNRISFLQHNYELEKNGKDFYQKIIKSLPAEALSHGSHIQISYESKKEMDKRQYTAINSANVNQGDDHKNIIDSETINIGSTLSERNERIAKIDSLIEALSELQNPNEQKQATRHCQNIKDEISEEEEPDTSMISKWLSKLNGVLTVAEKSADLMDRTQEVFEAFDFIPTA